MSLEDRFHNLVGLKGQMEIERQGQERQLLAQSDEFRNRYYPRIRLVCRAFAQSMGWEYEEAADSQLPFDFSPMIAGRRTPFQTCRNQRREEWIAHQNYSGVSLSLTLRSSAQPSSAKKLDKLAVGEPAGRCGGLMEVRAEFRQCFLAWSEYGPDERATVYAPNPETTAFADNADLDLDRFEALVAGALEAQYRGLLQLCLDSQIDVGDWTGRLPS